MAIVMYHPTKAPLGRLFYEQHAVLALDDTWVDTPAKFPEPEPEQEPEPAAVREEPAVVKPKRGRRAKGSV